MRRWVRDLAALASFGVAFAAALCVDKPLSGWLIDSGVRDAVKGTIVAEIVKLPGDFRLTLAAAALLWVFHPARWRAAGLLLLTGIVGGAGYSVLKWAVGRIRPGKGIDAFDFTPFIDGIGGLLGGTPNLAFPSGHTTLAFASAAALAFMLPRQRWAVWAVAAAVGLERVVETAHYPSDVVAGAVVGIASFRLTYWACTRVFKDEAGEPKEFPPGRSSSAADSARS